MASRTRSGQRGSHNGYNIIVDTMKLCEIIKERNSWCNCIQAESHDVCCKVNFETIPFFY